MSRWRGKPWYCRLGTPTDADAVTLHVVGSMWRIRAQLHSVAQTAVGSLLGAAFSYLWLQIEACVLLDAAAVCHMRISHLFGYADGEAIARVQHEYRHGSGPSAQVKVAILVAAAWAVFYFKASRNRLGAIRRVSVDAANCADGFENARKKQH